MFPAHAGVILTQKENRSVRSGVPRACGGDPATDLDYGDHQECSPRMRGDPNMNYCVLCQEYQKERVDAVLEVMLDIFFQTASTVRISKGETRPIGIVRKVFLALREEQVRAVLEALIHPRSKIYNHRKFILAMLYRSMSLFVLDNYEVSPIRQENVVRSELRKNRFHNFSQGEYDITELEKILIKNY